MKNIILLTVDALRKDVFGCYGGGSGLTPFIDSLQDKCIRFTNAMSTGPYTQAAFPGILTSSYYFDYLYDKPKILSRDRVLISEVLKKNRMTTAGFHSNAYLCNYFGWNRGWDTFFDSMDVEVSEKFPYVQAWSLNKKVAAWLSQQRGDNPFFLWLHYMDTHEPYIPEKKYIDAVDPTISLTDDEMYSLFKNVMLKRDISNKETVELLKKLYLAHVREVDEAIKEFFGILRESGFQKNSVIIITSDHGDEFCEHGGLSHDGKMYSELVNVPLMIYDYALNEGQISNTLVSTLDIPPTIVYLSGLEPMKTFAGHSLLPIENFPLKGVYGESREKHGAHEKGDEKEIHFYMEGSIKIIYHERDDSWEMYDLREDPEEMKNIIHLSPNAEEMKKKIKPRVGRLSVRT